MTEDELYEMSNFSSKTTGLPANITIWCRTDPTYHGHNRYRIKVSKDRVWAAIFTVGQTPAMVKNINKSLTPGEIVLVAEWIGQYSSLLISLIDGKMDTAEFSIEVQRLRGM